MERLLLTAISLLLGACATQSSVTMQPLMLDYAQPSRIGTAPVPSGLMVYQFLLAASVNPQFLTVSDPRAAGPPQAVQPWQENPADMLTNLTLRDLSASGLFARVLDQFSSMPYRYALEGTVQTIEGTIREGKALAILAVEVSLIDFEVAWAGDKILFANRYHVEMPARNPSAESIAGALNLAVEEYSRRLRKDLRSVLKKESSNTAGP